MKTLKAVLHAHSEWSYDGSWSLDAISRLYGSLGVDVVMMTEHDTGFSPSSFSDYCRACDSASTSRCRLIPGIEYSDPENRIHILTWGLNEFLAESRPVGETLEAAASRGGVSVFAHPIRRDAWDAFDVSWVPMLHGIEVWNRKSDGITISPTGLKLAEETGLPATVGHDFHKLRHTWPLSMEFEVKSSSVVTDVIQGLRLGEGRPLVFGKPLFGADSQQRIERFNRFDHWRRRLRGRT